MTDFKEALNAGFAAAEKAEMAKKEVSAVLKKLKDEILEASGGKLSIELRQFNKVISPELELAKHGLLSLYKPSVWDPMSEVLKRPIKEIYVALSAANPTVSGSMAEEIAEWKQSDSGYPCTLSWKKNEKQCQDRAALERTLADLLKDPSIAEKLQRLMRLESRPG
jgi:hypothetical protein